MKITIKSLIVIILLLSSCKTLQKEKGYEQYPKNSDWELHNYKN